MNCAIHLLIFFRNLMNICITIIVLDLVNSWNSFVNVYKMLTVH